MFKNAQTGDRVWNLRYGWGIIKKIRSNTKMKLEVFFDIDVSPTLADYTADGKGSIWDLHPELFWNEFKFPPEAFIKSLPKLEKDTKVLVWEGDYDTKRKRHFSHFDKEGKIYCYEHGMTSWTARISTAWENWELYKEE
jgi:hypothetical protein